MPRVGVVHSITRSIDDENQFELSMHIRASENCFQPYWLFIFFRVSAIHINGLIFSDIWTAIHTDILRHLITLQWSNWSLWMQWMVGGVGSKIRHIYPFYIHGQKVGAPHMLSPSYSLFPNIPDIEPVEVDYDGIHWVGFRRWVCFCFFPSASQTLKRTFVESPIVRHVQQY